MAALNKIAPNGPSRANPSELETQIATAIYDLETGTADMRSALRPLQFASAREVRPVDLSKAPGSGAEAPLA
jgi:small subunit ribosomal protein S7e